MRINLLLSWRPAAFQSAVTDGLFVREVTVNGKTPAGSALPASAMNLAGKSDCRSSSLPCGFERDKGLRFFARVTARMLSSGNPYSV